MNKLDVLVTHFDEPVEIVSRFLKSLSHQTFKDLKVTIVDDGLDCPDLNFENEDFGFPVEHLKFVHKTVSNARNNALKNTSAEYLMFCDCDDVFYEFNEKGLENAMSKIEKNDVDVYRTLHYVECWKSGLNKCLQPLHEKEKDDELMLCKTAYVNSSTIHSKIYRRSFVEKHDLKFDPELWMNEDGVFNSTAKTICSYGFGKLLDDIELFYVWKYNENSVTRQNKLYPLLGYDQYVKAYVQTCRKIASMLNEKNEENFSVCVSFFIFQGYYWLHLYSTKFEQADSFEKLLNAAIIELKKYFVEFRKHINLQKLEFGEIKQTIYNMMSKLEKSMLEEKIPFEKWVEDVLF